MFALPLRGQQAQDPSGTAGIQGQSSSAEKTDARFIKEAARGNDLEIAMGELGANKAQNPQLKSLCEMIQKDHTAANEQLKPIAQKYGVTLEQSQSWLKEHALSKLQKEPAGPKFDQALATDLMRDHQKDITKFQKAATELQAPDVKEYAQNMLPQLQKHFQAAQQAAQAVGVSQSTISSIANKLPPGVGGASEEQGVSSQKGAGGKELENK